MKALHWNHKLQKQWWRVWFQGHLESFELRFQVGTQKLFFKH